MENRNTDTNVIRIRLKHRTENINMISYLVVVFLMSKAKSLPPVVRHSSVVGRVANEVLKPVA